MARMDVDWAFPRSPRGVLKISRTLLALVTLICFLAAGAHGAYAALAGLETVFTALFLLLYLLRLDARMRCLCWSLAPLAVSAGRPVNRRDQLSQGTLSVGSVIVAVQDISNSVIAALFLLVVCLFAIIVKTNTATLVGGVLGLMLLVLCLVDAFLLFKKIKLDKGRGRSAPAK